MTLHLRELIDGPCTGCDHETSFPLRALAWNEPAYRSFSFSAMTVPIAKLSFWGVRGSTPTVDPATWRYGGNTPCLELIAPDGTQIILDCVTGLRMLGSRWAAPKRGETPGTHIHMSTY